MTNRLIVHGVVVFIFVVFAFLECLKFQGFHQSEVEKLNTDKARERERNAKTLYSEKETLFERNTQPGRIHTKSLPVSGMIVSFSNKVMHNQPAKKRALLHGVRMAAAVAADAACVSQWLL